jgi:hypothetical protein
LLREFGIESDVTGAHPSRIGETQTDAGSSSATEILSPDSVASSIFVSQQHSCQVGWTGGLQLTLWGGLEEEEEEFLLFFFK